MDEQNNVPRPFSYPNADRPLDSKKETAGPVASGSGAPRATVKFSDLMGGKTAATPAAPQKFQNENIKTYQTDVAHTIKSENVSVIKMALAEQRRQQVQGTPQDAIRARGIGKIILVISIILVLAGAGVAAYAVFLAPSSKPLAPSTNTTSTSGQNKPAVTSIKTEERAVIVINNKSVDDIKKAILKEKENEIDAGSIREIVISAQSGDATQKINTEGWFAALGTRAPQQLVRALGDDYTFGFYSTNPHDTFAIFEVKSFDNAFAAMLTWEGFIEDDIVKLFERKYPTDPAAATTTTATSTKTASSSSSVFTANNFIDRVYFNKDTRVLLDEKGRVRLLYSFIDPNTLVISSSETTFKEIIDRLTSGKIVR